MLIRYATAISAAGFAFPALAADMALKVEIPRLTVAEYHRPYVAIWIEKADQSFAGNLAVWYDIKMRNNEGTKWLKDMRAWWRKTGRELAMPVDGISGATRAPGEQAVQFADTTALGKLAPGEYNVVLEAAREVGGREVVKVPFVWPPKAATTIQARGEHELGAISVTVKP
ncbi:DUF2271 domain-containing protein [Hydrogenophaga sp. IBVHS1]|jgi:hypothetical protein|uniref:DUF2271 domain-containing protein n=1 Tax=unclassified Hydrogenophaga TaxID=2610897 RepID=UPI000A2D8C65|nr:DUF2271 domain-containing protein [Hydrogenophaga sp. IBVHS1]OSZ75769.1 hypothetical protein CAP37_10425 [Hydrogenophaga sp. IBVHS1]